MRVVNGAELRSIRLALSKDTIHLETRKLDIAPSRITQDCSLLRSLGLSLHHVANKGNVEHACGRMDKHQCGLIIRATKPRCLSTERLLMDVFTSLLNDVMVLACTRTTHIVQFIGKAKLYPV
jgi:hypothetical protein